MVDRTAVENQIAWLKLAPRNVLAVRVLVSGKMRQAIAQLAEDIHHEPRAIETAGTSSSPNVRYPLELHGRLNDFHPLGAQRRRSGLSGESGLLRLPLFFHRRDLRLLAFEEALVLGKFGSHGFLRGQNPRRGCFLFTEQAAESCLPVGYALAVGRNLVDDLAVLTTDAGKQRKTVREIRPGRRSQDGIQCACTASLVDLDEPIAQRRFRPGQRLLGLNEQVLVVGQILFGLRELDLSLVVLLDEQFGLAIKLVEAGAESRGLALGLRDRLGLRRHGLSPAQAKNRDHQESQDDKGQEAI